MLKQTEHIERLRWLCTQDKRVIGAVLYGSFTVGEGDAHSDIEAALFFDDAGLAKLDKRSWLEHIAPVSMFFIDDFGHYTAVFSDMVRAEFHFKPRSQMSIVGTWRGNAHFPSLDDAILVDRSGELTKLLQPLAGAAPKRDSADTAQSVNANFINVMLFGLNTLARGELARAHDLLHLSHRHLLHMARLLAGNTTHWPNPRRLLECDLPAQDYARFRACVPALTDTDVQRAYGATWAWGKEMMRALCKQHGLHLPEDVVDHINDRIPQPVRQDEQNLFDRMNRMADE
jgi:lincosamide nucleotidyltransferase